MKIPQSFRNNDPLMLAAKLIVGLGIGIMIFAMVMIILAAWRRACSPSWHGARCWLIAVALALALGLLFLGTRFLLELFSWTVLVRGTRVSRMGWLAIQAIVLALKSDDLDVDMSSC
jgi:hypothetical protein